jgi:hypothetical protein
MSLKNIVEDVIGLVRLQSAGGERPEDAEQRRGGSTMRGGREPLDLASLITKLKAAAALVLGGSSILALIVLTLVVISSDDLDDLEWLPAIMALVCGWAALASLWLMVGGLAALVGIGSSPHEAERLSKAHTEKELLEAIERCGEITPARAAMETSLTVWEADLMLSEFARKGYLVARVKEGGLAYALWDQRRGRSMLPTEGELVGEKDLREASIEQLISLRDRMAVELQRRGGQEGIPMPLQRRPDVPVASDSADTAEQPRPGEGTERPASE